MLKNLLVVCSFIALVSLVTGCGSTQVDEDGTMPVPEASADPSGDFGAGGGFGPGGVGGAGSSAWANADDFAGKAGDWTPVDPENRLGMPIIYFAYDSDVLVPSETANLDKIAEYISDKMDIGLVIEGHCDSRGTDEYNRALGERRANAIRAYLVSRGIADNRIRTQSFGEDKPAVQGENEAAWRKNRRGVPVPMYMR